MPIRLVLADDHPLVLAGLENLFLLEQDLQVLASCSDGEQALRAVRELRPDVLVLDLRMPGKDGLAVLRAMWDERLTTRVVILTAALDEDEVLEAIRLGARGMVLKEMAPRLLVDCVRKVHAGEEWLEKHSVTRALEKTLKREAGRQEVSAVLTPREMELVRLVAGGLRNKQIAQRLFISEGTVKVHLHSIYEKLHVGGRLALMLYAQEKGLV
jgi:two-component system, NarL family, nitrate/nitrite response regulator NarL